VLNGLITPSEINSGSSVRPVNPSSTRRRLRRVRLRLEPWLKPSTKSAR